MARVLLELVLQCGTHKLESIDDIVHHDCICDNKQGGGY